MYVRIKSKSFFDNKYKEVIRLDDIVQNYSINNVNHVIQDLYDILHLYYKIARKRFVNFLDMQATNYYLTTKLSTSLKLVFSAFVT